jgi:ribosomal protein S18 acetylase RimI-like enzyme
MFATPETVAAIESAEGRLCAELAAAAAARQPDARVLVHPLAGGVAVYAGVRSPVNKAIGVALGEPVDEDALAAVEAEWRDRGEALRVELATLAHESVAPMLTRRGYRLVTFENVLGQPLDALGPVEYGPSLRIDSVPVADETTWMNVTIDGFAQPDGGPAPSEAYPREVLEAVFADHVRVQGFRRYLARIDGTPAGAASMRVDGPIAQLAGAATLPAYRRRGVQTALLHHRLADAGKAGCHIAVITTQPGSQSQANAQRRGFALLYTRAILVREWEAS